MLDFLGEVHARFKHYKKGAEFVGLYWKRETGATGGGEGRTAAVYFQKGNKRDDYTFDLFGNDVPTDTGEPDATPDADRPVAGLPSAMSDTKKERPYSYPMAQRTPRTMGLGQLPNDGSTIVRYPVESEEDTQKWLAKWREELLSAPSADTEPKGEH